MNRRTAIFGLFATGAAALPSADASPMPATFRNPLVSPHGPDPWLTYYDGWYYLSVTSVDDIRMRRARRIEELKDAPDPVVWKDPNAARFHAVWAPEFHLLDGPNGRRWYLYYTASDGIEDAHHRVYVAESAGLDPRGPYAFKAQLQTDPTDEFYAIDGTVHRTRDGRLYLFWCGRPSAAGQGLYVARMENPWTVTGERTYLEADGFGCKVVREGPVTLTRGGKVYLVYSACDAATPDYRMGMLIADEGADLLKAESWRQHPKPVFQRSEANEVYGPGHCYFFKSPDGTEDWIAYHAKTTTVKSYGDRSTRVQRFTWNADGTPEFGVPLPLSAQIPVPSGEPPAGK